MKNKASLIYLKPSTENKNVRLKLGRLLTRTYTYIYICIYNIFKSRLTYYILIFCLFCVWFDTRGYVIICIGRVLWFVYIYIYMFVQVRRRANDDNRSVMNLAAPYDVYLTVFFSFTRV